LPVRANASGEAYRQARELPGVRRVGRVAEVSETAFAGLGQGRAMTAQAPPTPANVKQPTEKTNPEAPARPHVPHQISGPRTVVYTPPARGEQPFKNLAIPPERLKPADAPTLYPPKVVAPPKPVVQSKPVVELKPAAAAVAAPAQPTESDDDSMRISQSPSATEYRVVKSRRRDGLPYLVQRGHWQQVNGRRSFDVQWEKGFADREAADKHLGWIEHNEREMSALQSA
jgi:hypothetical protein